jgi:hypothetical protein
MLQEYEQLTMYRAVLLVSGGCPNQDSTELRKYGMFHSFVRNLQFFARYCMDEHPLLVPMPILGYRATGARPA